MPVVDRTGDLDQKLNVGKVVALAGGVGGAKLAHGLAMVLPAADLTVIVNTGDDFTHLGLRICPDIDTVCYTLAGLANPLTGWGRQDESWTVMGALAKLDAQTWFNLGDLDLATHLERSRRLALGEPLSLITADFCAKWGAAPRVLPMSDDSVATWVDTEEAGWLPFQEYFVHQQCVPRVRGFRFEGCDAARPAPGVVEALEAADYIVICPSNPWVSIGPILSMPGIVDLLARKLVVAVSPIIGGKAIKGPAAKMFAELRIEPSALAVAQYYRNLLQGFIFDTVDQEQSAAIIALGLQSLSTDSLMKNEDDRRRLAIEILAFCGRLDGRSRGL